MEPADRPTEIRFGYYLLQLRTEESGEASRVRGILEDLRTGERRAFEGLEELGAVLGRGAASGKR
jgi:hypothetical protein